MSAYGLRLAANRTGISTSDLYGNLFDKVVGRDMGLSVLERGETKIPNNPPTNSPETINGLAG